MVPSQDIQKVKITAPLALSQVIRDELLLLLYHLQSNFLYSFRLTVRITSPNLAIIPIVSTTLPQAFQLLLTIYYLETQQSVFMNSHFHHEQKSPS